MPAIHETFQTLVSTIAKLINLTTFCARLAQPLKAENLTIELLTVKKTYTRLNSESKATGLHFTLTTERRHEMIPKPTETPSADNT